MTEPTTKRKPRKFIFTGLSLLLLIFGIGAIAYGVINQSSPPVPSLSSDTTQRRSMSSDKANTLPRSIPAKLSIPAINVASELISVGKNADGTIEVPSGDNYDKAAWYKHSPTPGEYGLSIIEGHVDSHETGPSVFYNLGALKPEDTINIEREDGSIAKFKVTDVGEFKKDAFPTSRVYGPSDEVGLRLITCGGLFNTQIGEYDSNIIVFATLVNES